MTIIQDIRLPDLGDLAKADIIEILVAPGDQVAVDAPIITLESDKATLEIPSPVAGIVTDVLVKIGDAVQTGSMLLRMALETSATNRPGKTENTLNLATEPSPNLAPEPTTPKRAPGDKEPARPPLVGRLSDHPSGKAHASPSVRRFARELGVDLTQIAGSGPKNRILQDDVRKFVHRALTQGSLAQPAPPTSFQAPRPIEVDFSRFGPIDIQPLSRLRQLSGTHLHRSWLTIPHVTQFDAADITELEDFRQRHNKNVDSDPDRRLTMLPFVLKACAATLKMLPIFNSALDPGGKQLIVRNYIHIGIAVETINGLVVPVIRNVDQHSISQLAQMIRRISAKARAGKLTPTDMQGGCFSVSNLGGIGGEHFTPIINAPEAAILGLSSTHMRPEWNGQEFQPRLMLPLSLSYDHRIIDGADGARFTTLLRQLLGDIRQLLL